MLEDPIIRADSRWLLYDLARCPDHPCVIAAAGRLRDECFDEHTLTFTVESMAKTTGIARIRIPAEPNRVSLRRASGQADAIASDWEWDVASQTVLLCFAGDPRGIIVEINW